jgi:Lon-like ATP-dependent protease
VIDEELSKLATLEPSGSEFNVTRTYLDWMSQLPWGVYKEENLELQNAQTVLDEDHYGLKELKERILEFIAVGNLTGGVSGKIILLVGPPGTGKTSIGKSIARALDREFFRFSVGGMSDVSEIKGHRRTYVGAMPGKLIQALKRLKSSNPVVLIDEIDKMGRGHQGDPASALLEVLDPAQNGTFLDHYLDVGYDLSKVLFVCTANVLENIPGPLMDRMEVMRLSGYILEEKMEIAKRYLLPKSQKESGVKKIKVADAALHQLISDYAREAGVRNLEKLIDKIHRKAAYKLVSNESKSVNVTAKTLPDYVGQPLFRSDRYYEDPLPLGVVTGLAWTSMGGATLYIETVVDSGLRKGAAKKESESTAKPATLKTTGKMGEVMKESTDIALTYAKIFLEGLDEKNAFFDGAILHMHIPEGATPKDGPSAGVTMVTSLLSLALNKTVPAGLAMTGEITLTGKVLPVGGIKEKVIAAKRSGVDRVLLPQDNKRDWDLLDENIREGVSVAFCNVYADVWKALNKRVKKVVPAATATTVVPESVTEARV